MRLVVFFVLLLSFGLSAAEPGPLVIDKKIKPKSSNKHIEAVHLEIPIQAADLGQVRLNIIDGMLKTRGRIWTYEGEGDGYILARFDYRGNITVMRIEYNEQYVQLKYHGAVNDTACQNLVDGICYRNNRGYYNYTKNLRAAIELELLRSGSTS